MREIVRFTPNVPVEVSLRYPTGKLVSSQYGAGGQQVMFTIEGEKIMYLDLGVAQMLNDLAPRPGETFFICQRWTGKKTDIRTWDVWLSPATEKCRAAHEMATAQPDDTPQDLQLRRQLADSLLLQQAKKEQGRAVASSFAAPPATPARSTGTYGPAPHLVPQAPAVMPAKSLPPVKQQYAAAFAEFLVMAGRATKAAEQQLGVEGASIRFDSRDIAALATTAFIQAAKEGWVIWTPGVAQCS